MSLCDTCRDPGHCCRDFQLYKPDGHMVTFWVEDTPLAPLIYLAEHWLPFLPLEENGRWTDEDGEEYRTFTYACPLLENGRCSDYENRPRLCRIYEAGSDQLCAEFVA